MSFNQKKILMGESLPLGSMLQVGSHYYAQYFIKEGSTVFWLSTRNILGYIENIFTKKDGYKELGEIWKRKYKWINKNSFACSFLTFLPYARRIINPLFPWIAKNYLRFSFPNFKKILIKNKFQEVDILWISHPLMISLLKIIKYKILVYRIADNIEGFKHIPPSIKVIEKELISRADIVFTTAESLCEKAKKYNSKVYYLPNAVDYEHFARFKGKEPEEYQFINSPRIIYVGSLSEWIDVSILKKIALKLPNFSLVLIGPVEIGLSCLKDFPNVFVLGKRSFKDISNYLKYADVGIIPFKDNLLTNSIHPLKLYEYFAAGLPVVSRDLEEIRKTNSPAFLAKGRETFIEMIVQAYQKGKNKERYYEFARENSWDERFKLVEQYVLRKLN